MTLLRLSAAINRARQLAQALRGCGLAPEVADRIAEHLRAAQRLAAGKAALSPIGDKPKQPKSTRRRVLHRRDPHCSWCGRLTVFETHGREDSATIDHVHARTHPRRQDTRKHLPGVVLACYECNTTRGAPEPTTGQACPVIAAAQRATA